MLRNELKIATVLSVATIITVGFGVWGIGYAQQHDAAPAASVEKPGQAKESLAAIHSKRLPALQAALQQIIGHLEAGHTQMALAELKQVQTSLAALQKALGQHVKPAFINDRCPIMGSPINPANVAANLTRDYQGGKVAFCCAGCPAAWDKLSDAQKAAKLKTVAPQPKEGEGMHTEHPMGSMNM